MEAIDNAYIISGIEDIDNITEEQRKALDLSYEVAVSNGYESDINTFSKSYSDNLSKYNGDLAELKDMSIEEIADNYKEYENSLTDINQNLKIIDPTND